MRVCKLVTGETTFPRIEQLYGVEIEAEMVRNTEWVDSTQWRVVGDGSLRQSGREFVSPPLTHAHMISELSSYYSNAAIQGYETSLRTGIHVHADMRARSFGQVAVICAVYAVVEPILFELCGSEREECIYCVPWYRAEDEVRILSDMLNGNPSTRRYGQALDSTCKYSALYLEPLRRFGTIEFRQAPTFTTLEQMTQWLDVVRNIIRLGDSLGSTQAVVEMAENNLPELLGRVFPNRNRVQEDEKLINARDSIGVASILVRTRSQPEWEFEIEEVVNSREYYRRAGAPRRERLLRNEPEPEPIFMEVDEGADYEYDEEEDY